MTRVTGNHGAHDTRRRLAKVTVVMALATVLGASRVSADEFVTETLLDTLHTKAAPVAGANINVSRRLLPDVSTTTIPRKAPPSTPPRLDDPLAGDRLFLKAKNAAAAGEHESVKRSIRNARDARPGDSRIPLWQMMQALRNRDLPGFVWHVPGAVRGAMTDPLAAPRLLIQTHQASVLLVAIFWTVLVIGILISHWRPLAHDMTALILRDPDHHLRRVLPWILIVAVLLARPGWLGGLALLSVPLLLETRGRIRSLLMATWIAAAILVFPNLPVLSECIPVVDPESETSLLVRACEQDASPAIIATLRERLPQTDDPARLNRLQLALGHQEARRGRYTASSKQFGAVLQRCPDDLSALVGLANNSYFLSRFDEALARYRRARELAPERGEVPFNQAQVYFKKLFIPEAGHALESARALGFDPPSWQEETPGQADFSPAVYLGLSRADLRRSAQAEADLYPPLAWLASWNYFLGAPPLPLFLILAGLFAIATVLTYWGGLQDDIRNCDNCGIEICRGCCAERDGAWLCSECDETAARSRSEMVLATMLKNRSRAIGLATTVRLVRLARLLPGAAHLALGDAERALGRLLIVATAVFMIACGWAFDPAATWASPGLTLAAETVHPLWLPLPGAAWPGSGTWPVIAGWVVLAAIYIVGLVDAARLRHILPERFAQDHAGHIAGPGRA